MPQKTDKWGCRRAQSTGTEVQQTSRSSAKHRNEGYLVVITPLLWLNHKFPYVGNGHLYNSLVRGWLTAGTFRFLQKKTSSMNIRKENKGNTQFQCRASWVFWKHLHLLSMKGNPLRRSIRSQCLNQVVVQDPSFPFVSQTLNRVSIFSRTQC